MRPLLAACLAAALFGCSPDSQDAASRAQPGLGEADTEVAGVKAVLLEAKREGSEALLLRWEYRNEAGDKVDAPPGAPGIEVRDPAGKRYPLIEGTAGPRAAKVASPPENVSRIEVRLPGAAPIYDVRIGAEQH